MGIFSAKPRFNPRLNPNRHRLQMVKKEKTAAMVDEAPVTKTKKSKTVVESPTDDDSSDAAPVAKKSLKRTAAVEDEKKDKKDKKDKKEKKEKKEKTVVVPEPRSDEDSASDEEIEVARAKKSKKASKGDDDRIVQLGAPGASNHALNEVDNMTAAIEAKKVKVVINPDEPDENGNPPIKTFDINPTIVGALAVRGITHMFPIQAATFDAIISGVDVIGRARTGTGKTLAFTLPIVEKLLRQNQEAGFSTSKAAGRHPRVLVLSPTRELSLQIHNEFELTAPGLKSLCIYGGSSYRDAMTGVRAGVDVIVGTCGRVKDMLENKTLNFSKIQYVVLDEADEMLNQGFQEDVEIILNAVPRNGPTPLQTLLFSATLPEWVQKVADKFLRDEQTSVDLVKSQKVQASVTVRHTSIPCHYTERNSIMGTVILVHGGSKARTIVFVDTKREANDVLACFASEAQAIHGDIPQNQREATLKSFREGKFNILVATDVAARGIDIPDVELVINCEPPKNVETYVHRSGRTGRANKTGMCITFFTPKQMWAIQNIERKTGLRFEKLAVPAQKDIVKASAYAALERLMAVHEEVIPTFEDTAKAIIEKKGGLWAVSAALAVISGNTEPIKERSLLSSLSDHVTIQIEGEEQLRGLGLVWNFVRRYLYPEDADNKIKGIRITASGMGAVFDAPAECKDIAAAIKDYKFTVSIPDVLPDLQEREASRPPPPAWQQRRWADKGFGGGRGGGRGGFGGGFGGGRGGGGFRR